MRSVSVVIALLAASAVSAKPELSANPEAQAAYKEIEATFGFLPEFFQVFPEDAIASAWEEMKLVQLNPNGAIPGKYRELIALGVAAQVPCRYCTYFHTQTAKLQGATDAEIRHALAEASLTRQWSTWLNGTMADEAAFKGDIAKIVEHMKKLKGPPMSAPVTDGASALKDIEAVFGSVPAFIKSVPEDVLPAAWRHLKAVEMNPNGAVPGKYLVLTGLAVSAQVPCRYCVVADTEFARLEGASEREVKDAVLIAGLVRHWSTYFNGVQLDETKFRKDVDRVVALLKKKMGSGKTASIQ